MRTRSLALILALTLALAAAGSVQARFGPITDGPAAAPEGRDFGYVQLEAAALAARPPGAPGLAAGQGRGSRLDLATPAARAYGQYLAGRRDAYKAWLARALPQVEVVAEFDTVFNGLAVRLNGVRPERLLGGPGARAAGRSATYRPMMNASTLLTGAPAAWDALGGPGNAGAGIKVGIIDTGIDPTHPFLDPGGLTPPPGFPKGFTGFTSGKVIVARVFSPDPAATPADANGHGTHVAGTVAGAFGTAGPLAAGLSGMAPRAWLGNYNVFPGGGEADDIFIIQAIEAAVKDGMDVINMSLGGPARPGKDPLAEAVDAAAAAGVVVVVAAGNEGPDRGTASSPGTAAGALTAAATTNAHTFAGSVDVGPDSFPATGADNGAELAAPLTAAFADWDALDGAGDGQACAPLPDAAALPLAGQIAVVFRGACFFSTKVIHAAGAGAVGVVVTNFPGQDPVPMAMAEPVAIPAVMVDFGAGQAMRALYARDLNLAVATMKPPHEQAAAADRLAEFSSRGPAPDLSLKPDVAAPGVNVYSSVPGGGFAAFQGTSMATPHVAGAAALLRQYRPDWTPGQIKAALVGTAAPVTVREPDPSGALIERPATPLEVGGGRIDLAAALRPVALAEPASLSFGRVAPRSGRNGGRGVATIQVQLQNVTPRTQTYVITGTADVAAEPATLTLGPGERRSFDVMPAGQLTFGDHQGYIRVDSAEGRIRIPYLLVVEPSR